MTSPSSKFDLTSEQIQQFEQVFNFFDKNHDGKITTKELKSVIRSLGENPTEAEIQAMINEGDENNDGIIDFQEFLHLMDRRLVHLNSEEDLRASYAVFDREKKGYVAARDLRFVLTALKKDYPAISQHEIDEVMDQMDKQKDGKIKYERFVDMISQKSSKH